MCKLYNFVKFVISLTSTETGMGDAATASPTQHHEIVPPSLPTPVGIIPSTSTPSLQEKLDLVLHLSAT